MYGVYIGKIKVGIYKIEDGLEYYFTIEEGIKEVEKKGLSVMNLFKTPKTSKKIEFFASILRNCKRFEDSDNKETKYGYHTNNFYLKKE